MKKTTLELAITMLRNKTLRMASMMIFAVANEKRTEEDNKNDEERW